MLSARSLQGRDSADAAKRISILARPAGRQCCGESSRSTRVCYHMGGRRQSSTLRLSVQSTECVHLGQPGAVSAACGWKAASDTQAV